MQTESLKAVLRQEAGKGPSRRLRSAGMVPAILYGPKTEPLQLAVPTDDLKTILRHKGEAKLYRLTIDDGEKGIEKLTMIKDFVLNPLSRQPVHADFYEISMDHKVTADIQVHIQGIPVGIEMGGELQFLKRELKVSCLPGNLPENITIDVTPLKPGDGLRVKDIAAPEGVTFLDGDDLTIVFIGMTRSSMKQDEETGDAGTAQKQPEILKQKAAGKEA